MIKDKIKNKAKREIKKKIIKYTILILKPFIVPISICLILFLLVCYITDIFYLGINNEEKSNMKKEIKYYTAKEYTQDDSKNFFESVGDFISGIFKSEIIDNADWPVVGSRTITSYYGYRKSPTAGASSFHSGIDIAAPEGTKLVAIVDGKVTSVGWAGAGGYTITMISGEYTFTYCHCDSKFLVKEGEQVKKGQVIGTVGPKNVYGVVGNPYKDSNGNPTNGATTGCHCHFAVKKSGKTIDPLTIINEGSFA